LGNLWKRERSCRRPSSRHRWQSIGLIPWAPDGHFISCEPLICSDDGEAMAKAKRLVDGYDIEVWSGERFVARVESSRSKAT
jgi:hypothetical protein